MSNIKKKMSQLFQFHCCLELKHIPVCIMMCELLKHNRCILYLIMDNLKLYMDWIFILEISANDIFITIKDIILWLLSKVFIIVLNESIKISINIKIYIPSQFIKDFRGIRNVPHQLGRRSYDSMYNVFEITPE